MYINPGHMTKMAAMPIIILLVNSFSKFQKSEILKNAVSEKWCTDSN